MSKQRFLVLLLGIAIAGMVGLPQGVQAVLIDDPLAAIQSAGGDTIQIKYNNLENLVTTAGGTLSGIFVVTSIQDATKGTQIWAQGSSTRAFTGYYTGLILQNNVTANGQQFNFTGGTLVAYDQPLAQGFAPTSPTNTVGGAGGLQSQACGGNAANCTAPLLTANFAGGIDPADNTHTLSGSIISTNPLSGHGFGYLDVTGGTAGTALNTNGFLTSFGDHRDLLLSSDFSPCSSNCGTPGAGWPTASFDPVTGHVVPEPASLLLLGSGLAGLGLWRVRGRKNS